VKKVTFAIGKGGVENRWSKSTITRSIKQPSATDTL